MISMILKLLQSAKAKRLRRLLRLWPVFWWTGFRIVSISDDFRHVTCCLLNRWYNRNYFGIHFGGSLFMMTDPFYVIMILRSLEPGYKVIDQGAEIKFIAKGTTTLTAEFILSDEDLNDIRKHTTDGNKYIKTFIVLIKNTQGELIASVQRHIYIRNKRPV